MAALKNFVSMHGTASFYASRSIVRKVLVRVRQHLILLHVANHGTLSHVSGKTHLRASCCIKTAVIRLSAACTVHALDLDHVS